MSRLIVKNLPKIISEDKIKKLFSEYGPITDIQLKYKDGKFRQFAFVGYQNEEDAKKAVESLNNTFMKTNKINVEFCALPGDSNKPKSWSKYASDSTAYKAEHGEEPQEKPKKKSKNNKTSELLEKYKDDPMFEEFLDVHLNEAKAVKTLQSKVSKSKEDRDNLLDVHEEIDKEDNGEEICEETKLANQQISDMDYMKQLQNSSKQQKKEKKAKENVKFFTLKLKDLPYNCNKKDLKDFFRPLVPQSIRIPRDIRGIAYVGFKDEKKFRKGLLKDKGIISGRKISVFEYNPENVKEDQKKEDVRQSKWRDQEEALRNEEEIAESGRIFFRNLSYTVTEEALRPIFEKFGPLTEFDLPIDSTTRKIKGFGTVTYLMPEHAVKAHNQLDYTDFQGRMLHLLPAKAKDAGNNNNCEDSTNYKQKKTNILKKQSGLAHNWNSLFFGQNAIADVTADTFGTTKENVIGPNVKGNAAVQLALGETRIVAETRKYLEERGVILDAFTDPHSKRSNTMILIKNLPRAKMTIEELRERVEKYGVIGQFILPPSGITAIVEYVEPSEAKKAYAGLAYSEFKGRPLLLEWAPANSFNRDKVQQKTEDEKQREVQRKNEPETTAEEKEESEDEIPEPDTTLYVKNLNFITTDAALKKHFEKCGKIYSATVSTKKDPKNPGAMLSMGYGFVRFMTKAAANKALKTLQQSVLDGKSLELKRSDRTLQTDVVAQRKIAKKTEQNGTKISVKNIPFEAKIEEVKQLFEAFGEIKRVGMPMKPSGETHRGFGFIDFVTTSDAKKAFEALSQSTHLYGRRLVLEWAKDDSEDISGKRPAHFIEENDGRKRSKKSVFTME